MLLSHATILFRLRKVLRHERQGIISVILCNTVLLNKRLKKLHVDLNTMRFDFNQSSSGVVVSFIDGTLGIHCEPGCKEAAL